MLKNTFCHIPGVGVRSEERLWMHGLHSWEDFLNFSGSVLPLKRVSKGSIAYHLDKSILQLEAGNPDYFARLMPCDQHWRLFPEFRETAAFVDIETTGTGSWSDYITTIAVYDGTNIYSYVHGKNLEQFVEDVNRYKILVTYNGKRFDIPFIRNYLGVDLKQVHIDLRFVLASLGYRGGLKGCEKQLGICRDELEGVDGFFAVLLWDEYVRGGDRRALETLLAYNVLDVVHLETLMIRAYNQKLRGMPFVRARNLPDPPPPENPFKADLPTIAKIRKKMSHFGF